MKQVFYMLFAIDICILLLPVLMLTVVWNHIWDALDTAVIDWKECGKHINQKET